MLALGLDIGGANLKAADAAGNWAERPFAIWRSPESLTTELRALLAPFSGIEQIAVTMTAELADCYRTKADGIRQIVAAVKDVANHMPVKVWSTAGGFVDAEFLVAESSQAMLEFAASNWHALVTWLASRFPAQDALLIDIGSTTTDIIPFGKSRVYAHGRTDFERLVAGELLYTGIRRTPLCAVARTVEIGRKNCPLAAELFATTQDVYLLLGELSEDVANCDTANGRPATRDEAWDRLVRQVCCDRTEISQPEAVLIARNFAEQQEQQIGEALNAVLRASPTGYDCQTVIVSGSGRFLAQKILAKNAALSRVEVIDISEILKPAAPEAACAYAAAQLASSR
jgi:probable H4MPT-linked C1 transfer pathway protein